MGKSTANQVPRFIMGIDEAGRGPLAGPVVVGGVMLQIANRKSQIGQETFKGIRDSKKLSLKQREEWFQIITNHSEIKWAVSRVWPSTIDRINIRQATNLGARRVYAKLYCKLYPKLSLGQKLPKNLRKSGIAFYPKLSLGCRNGNAVLGDRYGICAKLSLAQNCQTFLQTFLDGGLSLSKGICC